MFKIALFYPGYCPLEGGGVVCLLQEQQVCRSDWVSVVLPPRQLSKPPYA